MRWPRRGPRQMAIPLRQVIFWSFTVLRCCDTAPVSRWQGSATYTLSGLWNADTRPFSGLEQVSFDTAPDLGGECGRVWHRALMDSWDFGIAHWIGGCGLVCGAVWGQLPAAAGGADGRGGVLGCWSGCGGERSDAGERFDEVVLPGPAGWEVQRLAPRGFGESSGEREQPAA